MEIQGTEASSLLARELSHRVFNNLQMLLSLLDIQLRETDSPEARASLEVVRSRLKSITLVNEFNIAAGGTGILDAIDLAGGFATAMAQMHSSPERKLSVSYAGPSWLLKVNTAMPLILIASEFVDAALATQGEASEIGVRISWRAEAAGELRLSLRSRGEGIDSKGMRLIEAMAAQAGAQPSAARGEEGFELSLSFRKDALCAREER
jgi:two-component sensor histidine kinase